MTTTIAKVEPKVGDIFYTSWGYDQTNVEFYKVVRVSKASVWVQETGQIRTDHAHDYWKTASDGQPLVRTYRQYDTGETVTTTAGISVHRIQYASGGYPCIKINSSATGWFWDGEPKQASTGH